MPDGGGGGWGQRRCCCHPYKGRQARAAQVLTCQSTDISIPLEASPVGAGLRWRECWGGNRALGSGLRRCNSQPSGNFFGIEPVQDLETVWIFLGNPNFMASYLFLDKTYKVSI